MKNKIVVYSLMFVVFAFFVNGAIYVLNINSPSNNFYINNQTPAFSFDIYGNTSTNNCTLYIDDLLYGTNESIANGTVVMIANDTLSEASHSWYINCSDEYGTNTTGTRTITVDVTNPTVAVVAVSDVLITESDSGKFYVNVDFSENMNSTILANITFQPSLLTSLNPCVSTWTNATHALYNCTIVDQNVTVNNVNITINLARDLANNVVTANISHSMFSIAQNGPTVSIDYPLGGLYYNVSSLYLNFTATGGVICWYKLDGNFTSLPGCADTTLSSLTEGAHTLIVYVNDSVNNTISDTVNFNVDTITPTYAYSISHSQISRANNSQEFSINIYWNEDMNQSVGPTLYFTPSISTIFNSCGYYWLDANLSLYNCTIYYILPYEQFDVNLTIFNASDLAGNSIVSTSYGNVTHIDMIAPQQTNYQYIPNITNENNQFVGYAFDYRSGFNYTGAAIDTSSCRYSLNYNNGPWYSNQTAFNGTHCVFNDINTSGFNNSLHSFAVNIADLWGNNISFILTSVFRDVSAPTTTASGNGYTFDTWTASPVNVTFTCSDGTNSSGCQAMYTCWDATNTCTPTNLTTASDSIYISSQGTFYVRYYSLDNLNTTESVKNSTIKIDTDSPAVSISTSSNQLLGASAIPYLVTGTASGGNSSINTLKLFVNGVGSNILNISGNNWNKTWSPSAGTYNLTAEVCNLAATCLNSSVVSNITFDLTAPTTTNNSDIVNWSNLFAITLSPTDTNGVAYTSYKIGSLVWQNGTTIIINSSTNVSSGNISILYYSVDSVGNQENNKNVTVKYDITAPTSTITGFLDDYSPYTFNEWSSDTALVNLSGTDAHSGYNRTLYCTDMSNTCTPATIWNVTLNITTPGITYIRYNSIDNINTAEVIRVSRVMIIQNNTVYINGSLNVTANDTNIIVPEDSNNSNIYVPPNVNATLDFSEIINISMNSTHNVTLNGSINTTVNTTIIIVFEIPQNLTLSGNSSWLGNFNLPKLMPLTAATVDADSGYTATKDIVVEVGADDVPLLLDKAVRIKLTGKSAKLLGFYRAGFTKITTTCANDTQVWADANLSASVTGHCRITVGSDLIIWTKHLSTFVTYTQTEDDDGGNNGGGSNSNNDNSDDDTPYVPANQSNPSVTYSYSLLEKGTRIINVTHSQIPLYGLALTTNANVSNARLKIILISNPPVAQAETVYKYFQIDHESINDSTISGTKLQFKVAKLWLVENKIEKNQVVLYRYINGWNMLTTTVIKEDTDNIYYEAASPGLSVFAIATKPKPPVTVVEPPAEVPAAEPSTETPPITDVVEQEVQGKTKNSNPIVVSIIVLIVIVILLFSFYAKKNKNGTHK